MPRHGSCVAYFLLAFMAAIPATQADEESRFPDWSGQWSRVPDGGVPRYDPAKPLRKQDAPLKPEYRARYEANLREQAASGFGDDANFACLPTTMPRQMSGIAYMEFVFSAKMTVILFEHMLMQPRRVYTDGREWPKNIATMDPTFPGYAIGRWRDEDGDGRYDILEIETRNIRGPKTWDQTGLPMADDNEAVMRERLYLDKEKPDILHNDMETSDSSLTHPWLVKKSYRRTRNVVWVENNCTEGNAYVTLGKEVYLKSGDGKLMPTRKDQQPPDLTYFSRGK